jgi:hypothetical protein
MSTQYYPVARPVGKAGLNGRIFALVAVGAVGGFLLGGVEVPRIQVGQAPAVIRTAELPAMDPSMGYADFIDTRPAVSAAHIDAQIAAEAFEASTGYGVLVGARTIPVGTQTAERALPAMDASMGFWGVVDTRPAVPAHHGSLEDVRAEIAALTAAPRPASMGHWDLTLAKPAMAGTIPFDEQRELAVTGWLAETPSFDEVREAQAASGLAVVLVPPAPPYLTTGDETLRDPVLTIRDQSLDFRTQGG